MKRQLSLFGLALTAIAAWGDNVGPQQAQQMATQFLKQQGVETRLTLATTSTEMARRRNGLPTGQNAYYVFNIGEQQGFIIMSGSSLTAQVLGYGDKGHFDADDMPENLKAWLENYAKEIAQAEAGEVMPPAQSRQWAAYAKGDIATLMKSEWKQTSPYNSQCPSGTVTGCVATAMGQIMNYWKHPSQVVSDVPAYSPMSAISAGTPLNWSQILDKYDSKATQAQKDAVASLMRICGQSVLMNWGSGGSAAPSFLIPGAMRIYFGYDYRAREVEHYDTFYFSDEEWTELLYNEVANKRPVVYSGYTQNNGGHSFIIDGYQSRGGDYFHVNWGWGGTDNGYFLLTAFNTSDGNYTKNHSMIIGLQPALTSKNPALMTLDQFFPVGNQQIQQTVNMTRNSSNDNFRTTFFWQIFNKATLRQPITVDFAVGIFKDGRLIDFASPTYSQLSLNGIQPSGTKWRYDAKGSEQPFSFGKGLADGEYELHAVFRETGTDEWLTLVLDDVFYCKLSINGNKAVLTRGQFRMDTSNNGTSGITVQKADEDEVAGIYDMAGRKVSSTTRGVKIIRYRNGTSRKVMR